MRYKIIVRIRLSLTLILLLKPISIVHIILEPHLLLSLLRLLLLLHPLLLELVTTIKLSLRHSSASSIEAIQGIIVFLLVTLSIATSILKQIHDVPLLRVRRLLHLFLLLWLYLLCVRTRTWGFILQSFEYIWRLLIYLLLLLYWILYLLRGLCFLLCLFCWDM